MRLVRTIVPALTLGCLLLPVAGCAAPVKDTPVAQRTIEGRPAFPDKMPGEINKRAISSVHFRCEPAFAIPMMEVTENPETITMCISCGDCVATCPPTPKALSVQKGVNDNGIRRLYS